MGDYTAIQDVAETLVELLRAGLPSDLVAADRIMIASPSDVEPDSSPRLLLFLYHVSVNPYLRNAPRTSPVPEEHHSPPLMVNLFFLAVPYAGSRETEYRMLGKIMQIIDSNPVLTGPRLSAPLQESDEIKILNQNLNAETLQRIWQAVSDRPYKLALAYEVTPVPIQTSLAPNAVHPVADRVVPLR
jgi:hypothetical protein